MASGNFEDALRLYQQAASLEPENATNFYQLFRVHSRMRKYADALRDITRALQVDPDSQEFRLHKAKLLQSVGQCDRALVEYRALNHSGPELEDAAECAQAIELGQKALFDENWEDAAFYFQNALNFVEQAVDLQFSRAQALFHVGDYYGVISDTGRVLREHTNHVEAYQLRGQAYTRLGDHETAQMHFREGLKLDPEHKGCKDGHKFIKSILKKEKRGDDAFDSRQFQEAIDYWWQAIRIDETHTAFSRPTLLKIVKAHTKLGEHSKAIDEAQKYLDDGETVEGLWALGDAQQGGDKYEEAVQTFSRANEIADQELSKQAQQKLKEAQVALKQSKEKNYYKILGVQRNSDQKEIKKAYRDLALKW